MKRPRELVIQDVVEEYLVHNNIFPASIVYCENAKNSIPNLCITFWSIHDYINFMNHLDYTSLCDKSGIILFQDSLSIILCGMNMSLFFEKVWKVLKD